MIFFTLIKWIRSENIWETNHIWHVFFLRILLEFINIKLTLLLLKLKVASFCLIHLRITFAFVCCRAFKSPHTNLVWSVPIFIRILFDYVIFNLDDFCGFRAFIYLPLSFYCIARNQLPICFILFLLLFLSIQVELFIKWIYIFIEWGCLC